MKFGNQKGEQKNFDKHSETCLFEFDCLLGHHDNHSKARRHKHKVSAQTHACLVVKLVSILNDMHNFKCLYI